MQLELPGTAFRHDIAAARALKRLGVRQWWCTACGTEGKHTDTQCVSMRPSCHVVGCDRPTCIQAPTNGKVPTCIQHYYNRDSYETPDAPL